MDEHERLEKKVARLELEVAALRASQRFQWRGIRKRASWGLGNLPWYEIAIGPDPERGEGRGHAKAVFALGDMATGVVAVGGLSRGVIAIGGLAAGVVGLGGLSLGLLAAIGGLAIGSVAVGGAAIGGVAIGGGAAGYYYACGGAAAGQHVVDATGRDPEALRFFEEYGVAALCSPPSRTYRR